MNASDGTGTKNLTNTLSEYKVQYSRDSSGNLTSYTYSYSYADEYYSAWSPDGSEIAYSRYSTTYGQKCDISGGYYSCTVTDPYKSSHDVYKMNASDGSNQTLVASSGQYGYSFMPSFSPDGSEIVFTGYNSGTGGDYDIQKAPADGSAPTTPENLTEGDKYTQYPSYEAGDYYARWGKSPTPSDTTAPTTKATRSVEPNGEGWNKEDITITLTATDEEGGSGVDKINYSATGAHTEEGSEEGSTKEIKITEEGETKITFFATDQSDNAEEPQGLTVKLDKTKPTVNIVSPVGKYLLNQPSVVADYDCQDEQNGSQLASCTGDLQDGASVDTSTSALGPKTFTVVAEDKAGNKTEQTSNYKVVYDYAGFFSPVDNNGVFNKAKAGSAIPVKFSLDGDQGLDIFYSDASGSYPRSAKTTCDSTTTVDTIEQTVTANSSGLTFDPETGQYNYTWKTSKDWAGTCRQLVVKLKDGEEYRAYFDFVS